MLTFSIISRLVNSECPKERNFFLNFDHFVSLDVDASPRLVFGILFRRIFAKFLMFGRKERVDKQ